MAPISFPDLHVACVDGQEVSIDTTFDTNDTIQVFRDRVAGSLNIHPKTCVLIVSEEELQDTQAVGSALDSDTFVCVLQEPCQIRPHQYRDYIDCDTDGFLPVDRICFGFGHHLQVPVELQSSFIHDQKILQELKPEDVHKQYVTFPESQGININMMPFEMGEPESLPAELRHYWPMIQSCQLPKSEIGKIGYLTIQESMVAKGASQRRPGLHIETPGYMTDHGTFHKRRYNWGCGAIIADSSKVEGGLYMASNVDMSCRLWNVKIKDVEVAAGHLGDMEHMRDALGEGEYMEANRMYWLTDATPHESVPLEKGAHRQFFRLVTSKLSAWYPEHSTYNELAEPDETITRVLAGSKFGTGGENHSST